MKEKRKHCRPSKLILTAVLAIALVLSPSLLGPGTEMNPAGLAYAESLEAGVELRAVKVDELNDKLVLAAYLSSTPDCGLSGIDFRLSWPTAFKLTKVEDKGLLGEGDKGTSFSSEELTDNPYYIAFGNMDESAGGVSKQTGAIAYFTFEPNDTSLTSGNYNFSLQDVHAVALSTAYEGIRTQSVTINGTQTCTYEAKTGNGTVSGNDGKITVSTDTSGTSGTPQVKTSIITSAINSAGTSSSITLDASTGASLALSKTGAEAIAKAGKNMTVKTNAGELTFDKTAAENIGKANGGEKLVITTSKAEEAIGGSGENNALKFSVDATLENSDTEEQVKTPVTSFGSGTVTVALNLPDSLKSKTNLICWNYTDTSYTVVNGDKSSDGNQYVFTTNHFSDYIVGTNETLNSFKGDRTEGVTVSGTVTSYNPRNEATVQLKQNDAVKYQATIAAGTGSGQVTQDFSIANVTAGTYDLVVTKAGHLTYTIKNVVVGNTALDLTQHSNAAVRNITLLAGDINGDGSINVTDLNTVWNAGNFNKAAGSATNSLTDINGDGSVNVTDLNIVWNAANFNKGVSNCTVSLTEE